MAYKVSMNRPLTYVNPDGDLDEMINLLIDLATVQQEGIACDATKKFVAEFATEAIEDRDKLIAALFAGMPRRKFDKLAKRIRRYTVNYLECFVDKYAKE